MVFFVLREVSRRSGETHLRKVDLPFSATERFCAAAKVWVKITLPGGSFLKTGGHGPVSVCLTDRHHRRRMSKECRVTNSKNTLNFYYRNAQDHHKWPSLEKGSGGGRVLANRGLTDAPVYPRGPVIRARSPLATQSCIITPHHQVTRPQGTRLFAARHRRGLSPLRIGISRADIKRASSWPHHSI